MMKRAPGRASAARRLRRLGSARRAAREATPAEPRRHVRRACARRSRRGRRLVQPLVTSTSALSRSPGSPGAERRAAPVSTPSRRSAAMPGGHQQRAGVERHHLASRPACHSPSAAPSAARHSPPGRRRCSALERRAAPARPAPGAMVSRSIRAVAEPDRLRSRHGARSRRGRRRGRPAPARRRAPPASSPTGSSSRGSATPSNCTCGSAGFTQGPSMFMIVRTLSARRTGPAWRRPGW